MIQVKYYDTIEDSLLKFAVIIARHKGQWVFCKHRNRNTYEIPGGHREIGEEIDDTAKRELWEETGATKFDIEPVCIYSVVKDEIETFGKLYWADIHELGSLPQLEIEKVQLFDNLPQEWTYPEIQKDLLRKATEIFSV